MPLGLAQLESVTADIQEQEMEWVEVAPGSYFKALAIHVPTNTVAFAFKMDKGAPDFPSHFHICRAMAFTVEGEFGYREGDNMVQQGMFSYEAAGSFHTPYSVTGFQSRGIFESDSNVLLENHAGPDPRSEVISTLTVQDFVDIASPITHIVHADGRVTGDSFKYDFAGSAAAQIFKAQNA